MIVLHVIIFYSDFYQTWPPAQMLYSVATNFDRDVKIDCNVC